MSVPYCSCERSRLLITASGGRPKRPVNPLIGSRTGHRRIHVRGCPRIMQVQGVLPGCGTTWTAVDRSITRTGGAGHEGASSKRSRAVQDCQHHGRNLSAPREGMVNCFNAVGIIAGNSSTQPGVIRSARVYLNARPIMRGSRIAPARPSIANNQQMLRTRRTVVTSTR